MTYPRALVVLVALLAVPAFAAYSALLARGSGGGHGHTHSPGSHSTHSPHSAPSGHKSHSGGSHSGSHVHHGSSRPHHSSNNATGVQRDSHGRIKRSSAERQSFERQTGYPHGRPGYVVDHVVPLKRGGADTPSNMQWQTKEDAKAKDRWE